MKRKKWVVNLQAYLFVGPFVALSAVFVIFPIISGVISSFYTTRFQKNAFVGLANYLMIFTDENYLIGIRNSILFVVTVVPLLIILGSWIAGAIFDKAPAYISAVRICLYVPVIASMVVMSIIWRFILDSQSGLVKYFSMMMGRDAVNILADKTWTLVLLIFILFTMSIGQSVILYVADMIGIPKELVEACKIDGGSRIDMYRYVLIPLTKATSIFIFITQTASVIRVFVVIQLLTRGGPSYQSTTMMYLLYQQAFEQGNTGVGSAIGVLLFVFTLVLVLLQQLVTRGKGE
ncbi:MAG: sugar ABC transporter permease [Hungatella hathewayi]|nr:sugar ABC transporter permease [Hungatella hathewayi]